MITALAATEFGCEPDRIDPDAPVDQLGIDSLDFLEFLFMLEDHFGITISPESVSGVRTLGGLVPVVNARLAEHASSS